MRVSIHVNGRSISYDTLVAANRVSTELSPVKPVKQFRPQCVQVLAFAKPGLAGSLQEPARSTPGEREDRGCCCFSGL
jgi:hypothetical protein